MVQRGLAWCFLLVVCQLAINFCCCMLWTDLTAAVKNLEYQKLDLEEQAILRCGRCICLSTLCILVLDSIFSTSSYGLWMRSWWKAWIAREPNYRWLIAPLFWLITSLWFSWPLNVNTTPLVWHALRYPHVCTMSRQRAERPFATFPNTYRAPKNIQTSRPGVDPPPMLSSRISEAVKHSARARTR